MAGHMGDYITVSFPDISVSIRNASEIMFTHSADNSLKLRFFTPDYDRGSFEMVLQEGQAVQLMEWLKVRLAVHN